MTYTEEDTFERLLTTGSLPSGPGSMVRGNIDLFRYRSSHPIELMATPLLAPVNNGGRTHHAQPPKAMRSEEGEHGEDVERRGSRAHGDRAR